MGIRIYRSCPESRLQTFWHKSDWCRGSSRPCFKGNYGRGAGWFEFSSFIHCLERQIILQGQIGVGCHLSLISKLLREFHTTPTGGHSGIFKTYKSLAQTIFWRGMKKAIADYEAAWHICQWASIKPHLQLGHYNPYLFQMPFGKKYAWILSCETQVQGVWCSFSGDRSIE